MLVCTSPPLLGMINSVFDPVKSTMIGLLPIVTGPRRSFYFETVATYCKENWRRG